MANAFQAIMDKAAKPPSAQAEEAPQKPKRAPSPRKQLEAVAPLINDDETPEFTEIRSKSYRPVREGKRFVGAHFPPEVARQLKMLAAEDETTVQELLEQAIDLLFVKHGKAKAADLHKK